MKGKEFIRRLKQAGVSVVARRGKGGHVFVEYKGKNTTIPFHGDADIGPVFIRLICKQLGLDPKNLL